MVAGEVIAPLGEGAVVAGVGPDVYGLSVCVGSGCDLYASVSVSGGLCVDGVGALGEFCVDIFISINKHCVINGSSSMIAGPFYENASLVWYCCYRYYISIVVSVL